MPTPSNTAALPFSLLDLRVSIKPHLECHGFVDIDPNLFHEAQQASAVVRKWTMEDAVAEFADSCGCSFVMDLPLKITFRVRSKTIILLLPHVPNRGDQHPQTPGKVIQVQIKWQDCHEIRGVAKYVHNEQEFDAEFMVAKDRPNGHTADIQFNEEG